VLTVLPVYAKSGVKRQLLPAVGHWVSNSEPPVGTVV